MSARLPTHNDLPTFECKLQRWNLLEQVAREIAEGEPPLVFSVHGDWGSGKTSFLAQLAYELSGDDCPVHRNLEKPARRLSDIQNVFPVWFEAWRYQNEPAPVVALLQEMCRQLPKHRAIARIIKKWGEVITKGFFGAIDELSLELQGQPIGIGGKSTLKIKNPVYKLHDAVEDWEKEHLASRLTTDHVRHLLTDAISKLLGGTSNDRRRVCVIIDDLDRCDPAAALKLLEGIRIHLSLPRCVFVLGINVQQVQRGLAPLLPGAKQSTNVAEQRAEAAEYLEKLCNFTWKLPFPSVADRVRLLDLWLQNPVGSSTSPAVKFPNNLRKRIITVAGEFECLPANPRKIKGLANTIRHLAARVWQTADADGDLQLHDTNTNEAADALIIAGSIDHFHPELLRFLQTYPTAWDELIRWVNGKSDLPPFSDLARLFHELQRSAVRHSSDDKEPTLASSPMTPVYPDPNHLSVFRIHHLLREATSTTRNTVTKASLAPFLKLAVTPPAPPINELPETQHFADTTGTPAD